MKLHNTFSCCIIGSGKLTLNCAQQLLESNHSILGIVSANLDIRDWAEKHNIAYLDPAGDQEAFLRQWDFDYLFSIINPIKVSEALLALPKKSAINYHDAPLPRYAGLHVTAWALMHQEKTFGVTWHEMTAQFDAGQILKQVEFPIDAEETVFSLNVKCFQKGCETFAELINELAQGSERRCEQNLTLRTSFSKYQRPDSAAIIDWAQSADQIKAMVRALSYQPDVNPLGTPKVLIGGDFYLVLEASAKESEGAEAPGTIVELMRNGISVATGKGIITLVSVLSLDGAAVKFDDMISSAALHKGQVLPSLDSTQRADIQEANQQAAQHEHYWLERLSKPNPYHFEQKNKNANSVDALSFSVISDKLSARVIDQLKGEFPFIGLSDVVVALYYCFLGRYGGVDAYDIELSYSRNSQASPLLEKLFVTSLPFRADCDDHKEINLVVRAVSSSFLVQNKLGTYSRDIYVRNPALSKLALPISVVISEGDCEIQHGPETALVLILNDDGSRIQWAYNVSLMAEPMVLGIIKSFGVFVESAVSNFNTPLKDVALINTEDRHKLLVEWNNTQRPYDVNSCVHQLFERQALLRPNDIALAYRDDEISYSELNSRAERLAIELQRLSASPNVLVGIYINRSIDMMIGLLGILKSGAAYVPLDPNYPRDRITLMIDDAKLPILITHSSLVDELPSHNAKIICVDTVVDYAAASKSEVQLECKVMPNDLAYVIYTSGSTGRPKGVMIEHGNVTNFFSGMDETLNFQGEPGVWLAVTSISFDISVLELFWTLSRGFKVVIQEESARVLATESISSVQRKMDVGLFYFSSDAGPSESANRYKLLLEGAKFADKHGFSSVWTPERHFHLFGGLYPNPSVTSAAIAAITTKVAIRAGSIVLPLHNPVRVVEEWSVVDNISAGRVGFSFASGWHANDFSLLPENFANRKQIMFDNIKVVRDLWAGKEITLNNGEGKPFSAKVFPAPVQKEPPIWITTAGNVDTFRQAGEGGFNVLTNLLGQSIEEIKDKITAYRAGRKQGGHEGDGIVSVMVHTFIGTDVDAVRDIVRAPFSQYLKTSFDLVKIAPWAFPAFRQPSRSSAADSSFNAQALTEEDLDALLDHAFERYFETAGIFGTPASCLPLIDKLKTAGVDEIACLVDFGVDDDVVLDSLVHLNTLRELAQPKPVKEDAPVQTDFSLAAQMAKHKVTHFQCTPSMARMLSSDFETLSSIRPLKKLLLGGEALPMDLAASLKSVCSGDFINVYGPTETTIWSTSGAVPVNASALSIGRPIANTYIYILDRHLQPVPIGVPGELFIGGKGVVRGYLGLPELTDERFLPDTFSREMNAKMYRTGDLVQYRYTGDIEYIGRLDCQVKLRGYRIELGEIESLICADNGVKDCVVVISESDSGTQNLVAYVVAETKANSSVGTIADNNAAQQWQTIWNETYQAGTYSKQGEVLVQPDDPTLNLSGWLDSYTGLQHAEVVMLEWANATADRILALKPKRVLEIGCGTGMILYRVAPHCQAYVGVDFSEQALELIQQQLSQLSIDNVQLHQSSADSIAFDTNETFDLIVINSVIQYFPSADYLIAVLKNIMPLLSDRGRVFIGDVRSAHNMNLFHHSLELAKAPANLTLVELQQRIAERLENESELLVSPDFFYALPKEIPRVQSVNVSLKRGANHNEMSMFRYDVCLERESFENILTEADFQSLEAPASLAKVCSIMADQSHRFVLRDMRNDRLVSHVSAMAFMQGQLESGTVSELRRTVLNQPCTGIDPEQLYTMPTDWRIELTWASSGKLDCYDAYFIPPKNTGRLTLKPQSEVPHLKKYCFEPVQQGSEFVLVERLKEALRRKLPEFMVPNEYLMLKALPLTPNGKIDRKALPKLEKRRREVKEAFVAPADDIERIIATVLQEMLNLEKIGTRDNFMDLGANSLLIVQANNRLSQRLGKKVSLVSMYRYPTIASLAECLRGDVDSEQGLTKGQQRGEKRKAALAGRRQRLSSSRDNTH